MPNHWPDAFCMPGVLPNHRALAAAGPLGALFGVGGAAAQLLATLAGDMVAKQGALERLQRQLDAADARCEGAASRLRDMQGRNR
jgi:hypothetical protein